MVKPITSLEKLQKKSSKVKIIKRNGDVVAYNPSKMRRVVDWACDDVEWLADDLVAATEFKMHDKIKITDLYDELIKTATNKISVMYPQWEMIAAKLYLLKVYKDTWNCNKGYYPHLNEVLAKGVAHHIYDKDFVDSFSDDEIDQLNAAINTDNDYLFTFKSLYSFFDKYCLMYSKTKKLELPQISYMRVAMFMHHKSENKIDNIIETYNYISSHAYTLATPIMLNAGMPKAQLSSCVLSKVADDTVNIMDTMKNLGVYSKFKGGTAIDISEWRSKGSYIKGTGGVSSGPVPFLKIVEATMKAFNQGGKRPGANCVYFQWWHIDYADLIVLKSNGGTDENRCRGLKFGLKINQYFIDAFINDETVSLFDPKDAISLIGMVGEAFNAEYRRLESTSIRRKRVPAREMFLHMTKERTETGNIYLFHEENVNLNSMLKDYVNSSNLCAEVLLPSRPSVEIKDELILTDGKQAEISKRYTSGEVALCNLASVNLVYYNTLNDVDKSKLCHNIVHTMDNTIDLAYYPVKEAMNSNIKYRYLGIGVLNYANWLACEKIVIDTQEAMEKTSELFDELSYNIINSSCTLAKDKGKFGGYYNTHWSDGKLPIDFANKHALKLTEYKPDMKRWGVLRERIALYGVRNAQLMAVAPTACQTKDSVIKTDLGNESLEELMNRQGIDHNSIETDGVRGWYNFNEPITLPTRFGNKQSTRIWYNGKQPTRTIAFEDGNSYTFTYNHKLLVKDFSGAEKWVEVKDITEDMDIVVWRGKAIRPPHEII